MHKYTDKRQKVPADTCIRNINSILHSVFSPDIFSKFHTYLLPNSLTIIIPKFMPLTSISRMPDGERDLEIQIQPPPVCVGPWGTGSLANAVCCPFFQAKNRLQATVDFIGKMGKTHMKHWHFFLGDEWLMVKVTSYISYFIHLYTLWPRCWLNHLILLLVASICCCVYFSMYIFDWKLALVQWVSTCYEMIMLTFS